MPVPTFVFGFVVVCDGGDEVGGFCAGGVTVAGALSDESDESDVSVVEFSSDSSDPESAGELEL